MLHQRPQPLRVEVAGVQFYLQGPLQGIHFRVPGVRVLQYTVFRRLPAQVFYRVGQATLEIKAVVIVQ